MTFTKILLVHGMGSTPDANWRRPGWIEVLEADGHLTGSVRLPGHDGAALDHSAADATLAAAHLEPAPVAAIGFSAGALAVLDAAAAEPNRFARIAILGVGDGVLGPDTGALRSRAAALRSTSEPDDPDGRMLWQLVRRSGNDVDQVAQFLESAALTMSAERLARITCPVLVVIGDRDGGMPADGLVEALPSARLEILPGVDHFATVTSIGAFEAVTRFLADR